jgi:hypothetical protein
MKKINEYAHYNYDDADDDDVFTGTTIHITKLTLPGKVLELNNFLFRNLYLVITRIV